MKIEISGQRLARWQRRFHQLRGDFRRHSLERDCPIARTLQQMTGERYLVFASHALSDRHYFGLPALVIYLLDSLSQMPPAQFQGRWAGGISFEVEPKLRADLKN